MKMGEVLAGGTPSRISRKRRPSTTGRISRKAMHGCPCGMAQQLAEIDPWPPAVIACGYLPRFEIGSGVGIQVDPFVLA